MFSSAKHYCNIDERHFHYFKLLLQKSRENLCNFNFRMTLFISYLQEKACLETVPYANKQKINFLSVFI